MGTVHAVCLSEAKGTAKRECAEARLVVEHGLDGDAHAGSWHRQVSLLPLERIEEFRARGAQVVFGDFGENLVVEGIDWDLVGVGSRLRCGTALLEITQLGKECHDRCAIYQSMGDCIMPRHGVFARVVEGGTVQVGTAIALMDEIRAALLTVSDSGSRGEREDVSGQVLREMVEAKGIRVTAYDIVPDELSAIASRLEWYSDVARVSLVLTSGGTGFSLRDVTPEATLGVVDRECRGIPEAMRVMSLDVSRRAMLSRAAAGIRKRTLIVNLPGSPRAVRECLGFVIDELTHGIEIIRGDARECAAPDRIQN